MTATPIAQQTAFNLGSNQYVEILHTIGRQPAEAYQLISAAATGLKHCCIRIVYVVSRTDSLLHTNQLCSAAADRLVHGSVTIKNGVSNVIYGCNEASACNT